MLNLLNLQRIDNKISFTAIIFILFSLFSLQVFAEKSSPIKPIRYEYAIFYMETEGEFVVPVGADAPAIYSWSQPGVNIKGDIIEIWKYLSINAEVEYSFTDIENIILNHVADMGWELSDLAVTSVPLTYNDGNFRTAYRYVFKRQKQL